MARRKANGRQRTRRARRGNSKTATRGYVKSLMKRNIETKQKDFIISAQPYWSTTSYDLHLSNIAQGTSRDQRVGIKAKIIGFRYFLRVTGADEYNQSRFMLYRRKAGTSTAAPITSITNPVDTDNYVIYRDHSWSFRSVASGFTGAGTVTYSFPTKVIQGYVKVNKMYDWSPGTYPVLNTLWLQMHGDSGPATAHPSISGYVRVYFEDA